MPCAGPVHPRANKSPSLPGRHHPQPKLSCPLPAHLVGRTRCTRCVAGGTMTLVAVHAHPIPDFLPLLPPPGVGHERRAFKQLRSRNRAEPSSRDSQEITAPAAAGPPLHSPRRREPAGGGHPPCGPVRSAAVYGARTSAEESPPSAQGRRAMPRPGPGHPGRCPRGRAETEGTRPAGLRRHSTCGGRAGCLPGVCGARS